MRSICFVTNEIYPLHPGGIGRLMYNFCVHNRVAGSDVQIHMLLPPVPPEELAQAQAALGAMAQVHSCTALDKRPDQFSRLFSTKHPSRWDFSRHYEKSFLYFMGLSQVQARLGRPFDIIEFLDFSGLGMAAIAAKKAGIAFQDTILSVRLHSTLGLISRFEKFYHHPSTYMGYVSDLERYALRHADLIVGHVPAIAERNHEHYAFDADWMDRVVIEFPLIEAPVGQDAPDEESDAVSSGGPPAGRPVRDVDFLFSSRLQPFKRPDLFIKGAVGLLEQRPGYRGVFRLLSYGWDREYVGYLKRLVPDMWSNKIVFREKVTPAEREAMIGKSVVVIPSDYESLCLFAFEAAGAGSTVILNAKCEAFGSFDRWKAGENCLMFDGTGHDLARAMAEAVDWKARTPVDGAADALPYWRRSDLPARTSPAAGPALRLGLVRTGFFSTADVTRALLETRYASEMIDLNVVAMGRAWGGDHLDRMVESNGAQAIILSGLGVSPEELGVRIAALDCDVIALCPPDIRPHPGFFARARKAFERNPDLVAYSTHLRTVHPASDQVYGVQIYAGEMPSTALSENTIAPRLVVIRKSALARYPFDDRARDLWLEAWLRRIVLDGAEVLIAPVADGDIVAEAAVIPGSILVSGTLYDDLGIAAGLPARFMALEPKSAGESRWPSEKKEFSGSVFQTARRIWPSAINPREFSLVHYRPDLGGLLVHPIANDVVIAEIELPRGSIRHVLGSAWLSNVRSTGVQIAVACAQRAVEADEIRDLLDGRPPLIDFSGWRDLSGGERVDINMSAAMPTSHANRALLFCRVPRGGSEDFGHLVFEKLTVDFDPGAI